MAVVRLLHRGSLALFSAVHNRIVRQKIELNTGRYRHSIRGGHSFFRNIGFDRVTTIIFYGTLLLSLPSKPMLYKHVVEHKSLPRFSSEMLKT